MKTSLNAVDFLCRWFTASKLDELYRHTKSSATQDLHKTEYRRHRLEAGRLARKECYYLSALERGRYAVHALGLPFNNYPQQPFEAQDEFHYYQYVESYRVYQEYWGLP